MNVGSLNSWRINSATINGNVAPNGIVYIIEKSDDLYASGGLHANGSVVLLENRDTLVFTGALQIVGSASFSENPDSFTANGQLRIQGLATFGEARDSLLAIGELPRHDVLPRLRSRREDRAARRVVLASDRRAVAIAPELRRTIIEEAPGTVRGVNFAFPHIGGVGYSAASINGFSLNGLRINGAAA